MSKSETVFVTKEVSKEQAKRMIDESPADTVFLTIVNMETQISGDTESIMKSEGHRLVDLAKKIGYENHDMFGRMNLKGIAKKEIMHCIAFVQGSPPTSEIYNE